MTKTRQPSNPNGTWMPRVGYTLPPQIVEAAKRIAQRRGTSASAVVAETLRTAWKIKK